MATKKKIPTLRQLIHLTFPQVLINQPILSLLAKRFDVVFNIKSSTVTSEMALVSLELEGGQKELTKSVNWLKAKGVTVEPIGKSVALK